MIQKNSYFIKSPLFFVFIFILIVSTGEINSVEAKSKGVDIIKQEPSSLSIPMHQEELDQLVKQHRKAETEAEKTFCEEQIKQYDDEFNEWLGEHSNPEKEELVREKQKLFDEYRRNQSDTEKNRNNLQKVLPVTKTGYDIISGSLEICIDPDHFSDKEIKQYIKQIRKIVGTEIDLTISPAPYAVFNSCNSATSICDPMVSGITFELTHFNCTLGFKAKFNNQRGFTTAGHCLDVSSGVNKDVGQPSLNNLVGKTRLKYLVNDSNGDCAFIENTSDRKVQPQVLLFDAELGTVERLALPQFYIPGVKLEFFGAASGVSTSRISALHQTVSFEATNGSTGGTFFFIINDLIETRHRGLIQGDSGGPAIKDQTKLAGLLTGTGANRFGRPVFGYFIYPHVFNEKFGSGFSWDFSFSE